MSDILDSIKDRISNPFIVSFSIAWIFWNWQITIGLFWYDHQQLKAEGYSTLFDFIESHVDILSSLVYPVLSAFGYLIAIPLVKSGNILFNSFIDKVTSKHHFRIAKKTPIDFDLYLAQLTELENQKNTLAKSLNEKETSEKARLKLEDELSEIKKSLNAESTEYHAKILSLSQQKEAFRLEKEAALKSANEFYRELYDHSPLTGRVLVHYLDGKFTVPYVKDGVYLYCEVHNHGFYIENFIFDSRRGRISFVKKALVGPTISINGNQRYFGPLLEGMAPLQIVNLVVAEGVFTGTENYDDSVEYVFANIHPEKYKTADNRFK